MQCDGRRAPATPRFRAEYPIDGTTRFAGYFVPEEGLEPTAFGS
jgi:hypothetical protein